jgi:hypothetical protein
LRGLYYKDNTINVYLKNNFGEISAMQSPPSLRIVTAFDSNFSDLADISVPLMKEYASLHGYKISVHNISMNNCILSNYFNKTNKRNGWIKIPAIIEALKGAEEYLLWLDIDILIASDKISIINEIHDNKDLYLVWHDLKEYSHVSHYNTGVLVIKNCDWSRNFFELIWTSDVGIEHRWWDQAAFHHLIGRDDIIGYGQSKEDPKNQNLAHIGTLDLKWNSIVGYKCAEHPLMHHYAGIPHLIRRDMMKLDAALGSICRHNEKLALERIKYLTLQKSLIENHYNAAARFNNKLLHLSAVIENSLVEQIRYVQERIAATPNSDPNSLLELRKSKRILESEIVDLKKFIDE